MNQFTNPVTEAEHELIRRLHAEGKGRNEIARITGRAQRTISIFCAAEGLEFDCTWTEEATRHRMAQLAEKRSILAEALTDDALRLSAQLWQPAKIYNFGGKENDYNERDVPEPPADAKRALIAAATSAAAESRRLVPPVDDSGEGAARGLVGDLITGLTAVHRARQEQREEPADEGAGDAP
ncbi:helix-turn-helix domain-containing protein [Streptomyces sp.]|uniref:helix-turn-helix domain-containing protein n=1 Tax=Streptomyces sp. TaxID=1931 RepID=UPI002D77E4AB|nr:helix-turn-helix domain-containing protein [Streptomyces sp.]HET6353397.1 helix-turn-helix domain-containing protein [Streptomyces sp.]